MPENQKNFDSAIQSTLDDTYLWFFSGPVNIGAAGNVFRGLVNFPKSLYSDYYRKKLGVKYLIYNWFFRKKVMVEAQQVILVYFNLSDCYFHWMLDVLPRLYLVKDKISEATVLLPMEPLSYQRSTLEAFGVNKYKVLPPASYFFAHNVWMPDFTAAEANYNPAILEAVRSIILKHYYDNTFHGSDKIYIRRKNTSIRHVTNEEELLPLLHAKGYKTIFFEDFSFKEQLNLAAHAKVMISIHGAGLTNILFMPSSSIVLEFKKEEETGYHHYFNLANALNLDYYCLFCKPDVFLSSSKIANLSVPVKEFESLLNKISERI